MAKVGDDLIKPMLRALDDLPVHGRQLGDLTRGLKRQQRLNRDGVTSIDTFDDRVQVSLKRFKKNKKHDQAEFDRQYNEQIDTLQNMSVADWKRNRDDWNSNRAALGPHRRTPDSVVAQQAARDIALEDKFLELRGEGQRPKEAMQNARDWLRTQAATHRLDGIAGGDVTDISGVGDARVNSSLGAQWRSRVGDIDTAVDAYIAANPGADLGDVYMNIAFR